MTASRPDTALPIDVYGELRLDGPSQSRVTLRASGSRLTLAVPGWATLHDLGPRSLLARRRALVIATRALRTSRLTLDVDVDGRRAFGLGEGVRRSLLARLFGLASGDIRVSNVVSLLRSRGAARHADRR
ncbi:MAG: hypothetical protein KJO56_12665 [Gammaproteobacteria bacterium]|nr:hypothetical protein [Gammaproteobacteria bacterium]MBT8105156.1 hypothetical protein [Gammaproteobacteria bacterium]NNK25170.1 hypothetical protein [Woeseiaceae bacterium]